jgi:hypothetical protein
MTTTGKFTRKRIEGLHLRQLEHLGRQIEARDIKAKHLATRREWLQRQTNANYRNEYDRLRGELSRSTLPFVDKSRLQQRERELERLFSSGNV